MEGLSPAQKKVAELVAQGLTNKEIAAKLFVTVSTVSLHIVQIYKVLGIDEKGFRQRLALMAAYPPPPHDTDDDECRCISCLAANYRR